MASKRQSQNLDSGQSNNSSFPGGGEGQAGLMSGAHVARPFPAWVAFPSACAYGGRNECWGRAMRNLRARKVMGHGGSKYLFLVV